MGSSDESEQETRKDGDLPPLTSPGYLGAAEPGASSRPSSIGPYRILDVLGRGGMATVYLAEQSSPIQRRVALKVIDAPLRDDEARRRFLLEQQAMAVMSHPYVAKIFEAGTSETGWPYLAMEVVEGEPVTTFADERRLSVRERVAVLASICRGVEHAHRKGILHRDLKPSNVLVESVDGDTVPKIIDFGIAKAIDRSVTQELTAHQTTVGTPMYMSPEALAGDDVDTRSDVYSLGVMLFELLVGSRPFEDAGSARDALVRNVLETDPPRPSTYYKKRPADTQELTAECRNTTRTELHRELSGDLGWVAWKALSRDREERYASASDLADDLDAWLGHRPVNAHPPSLGYRLAKFTQRNRTLAFASSLVLIALLLGVLGTAVGFVQARREAERAGEEARAANQAADFLESLFEASSPGRDTSEVTARELLDLGAAGLRESLTGEPLLRARLLLTLGRVYSKLGENQEGVEFAREAVEVYDFEGGRHSDLARALEQLSTSLNQLGENEEAIKHAERSLILRRAIPDTRPSLIARTLQELGVAHALLGRKAKAETVLLEAMEVLEDDPKSDRGALIEVLNTLGALRGEQGKAEEAGSFFARAIEVEESRFERPTPALIGLFGNLAAAEMEQGKLKEAEQTFARTVALAKEIWGNEHYRVGNMLGNQGRLFRQLGRMKEAEARIEEGHAILLAAHASGPHYDIGLSHVRRMNLFIDQERFDEAEEAAAQAIAILRVVRGPDSPIVAEQSNTLGYALLQAGRPDAAEPHLRDALTHFERLEGPETERGKANARSNLGRVLLSLGKLKEADDLLQNALSWREENLGYDHEETLLAVRWRAPLMAQLGRRSEAKALYDRVAEAPNEAMSYIDVTEFEQELQTFRAAQ